MKIVDVYVIPMMVGGDDKDEALRQLAVSKFEEFGQARKAILMKKESIMKRRAMKRYMFGRFATKVPQFKEYRYRDVPLPESYASQMSGDRKNVTITKRSHGQTLVGEMIPTWGDAIDAPKIVHEE